MLKDQGWQAVLAGVLVLVIGSVYYNTPTYLHFSPHCHILKRAID
jgi:hypothetical protein